VSATDAPGFMEVQRRFAAHIRDPANNAKPADVSPRRMAVYTDLFFRNLEQLLANGFPVIRRITPEERWNGLVRAFMAHHHCQTPLFPEIGKEFAHFLIAEWADPACPPFLGELACYEYLEVTVALSEDEPAPAARDIHTDVLDGRLRLSTSARVVQYRFPVHRIGPDYLPDTAPDTPTYLLVYRAPDERVRFMELNPLSYSLLELLRISPDQTARAVLLALAKSFGLPHVDQVVTSGAALLQDLRLRGAVVCVE
jgi:uncharacterized protein